MLCFSLYAIVVFVYVLVPWRWYINICDWNRTLQRSGQHPVPWKVRVKCCFFLLSIHLFSLCHFIIPSLSICLSHLHICLYSIHPSSVSSRPICSPHSAIYSTVVVCGSPLRFTVKLACFGPSWVSLNSFTFWINNVWTLYSECFMHVNEIYSTPYAWYGHFKLSF